jgi:hypothetical protein
MNQRYFQKPNGEYINERVQAVVFDMSGEKVQAYSIDLNGNRRPGAAWTLKNALSLVETGHWVELRGHDEPVSVPELDTGAW